MGLIGPDISINTSSPQRLGVKVDGWVDPDPCRALPIQQAEHSGKVSLGLTFSPTTAACFDIREMSATFK